MEKFASCQARFPGEPWLRTSIFYLQNRRSPPSPPLHDASEAARFGIPTVMMLVQSLHGISHNTIEDKREERLEMAVTAFDKLADKAIASPRFTPFMISEAGCSADVGLPLFVARGTSGQVLRSMKHGPAPAYYHRKPNRAR